MSGLLALSPGRISTPWSPPLRALARLSRRKALFGLAGPWQRRQEISRIGLTSRVKSIFPWAGGGNLERTTVSGAAQQRKEENSKKPKPTPRAREVSPSLPAGGFISIEKERLSVGAVNR